MDTSKFNFIRTCQECGHEQKAKDPSTYVDPQGKEPWRVLPCKKCGSEALDYGTYVEREPNK
jgi:hypothetical protein